MSWRRLHCRKTTNLVQLEAASLPKLLLDSFAVILTHSSTQPGSRPWAPRMALSSFRTSYAWQVCLKNCSNQQCEKGALMSIRDNIKKVKKQMLNEVGETSRPTCDKVQELALRAIN